MTLDRHVGTITCGECGRTWHGRGAGLAFCGWCGAYFGTMDTGRSRAPDDRRRRAPRRLGIALAGTAAIAGFVAGVTAMEGRPGRFDDSQVELEPRPDGLAIGDTDPGVGQTGPWCATPTRTGVDCTKWLVTTIGDPTAWLGTTGEVVARLTVGGDLEVRSLDDGSVRWSLRPGWGAVDAAIADGRIVVASPTALRGVNAATGIVVWEVTLPASIRGLDVSDAVAVLSLNDDRLLGVDPATGGTLWMVRDAPADAVVVTSDVAAVADASTARITAYELRTGAERWSTRVGGAAAAIALVGDEDRIVVMTTFAVALRALGEVTALGTETGTVQWRHPLPVDRGGRIPMALVDGLVLLGTIGSDTQPLVALGADGDVRWTRTFGPGSVHPAGADPGPFAITDLSVVAVDPADGTEQWSLGLLASAVSGADPIVVAGANVLLAVEPPE